jgi:hypothetical protein
MGSRQGGRNVSISNLVEVRAALSEIQDDYLKETSKNLRRYTRILANDTLIPGLKRGAAASGVPIAPAMADTARAKADRIVTVRIGAVNPKLSGFRPGVGAKKAGQLATRKGGHTKSSQSYRTTLAWGSDRGPYPGATVNHYAVGQSKSHWVLPTLTGPLFNEVKDKYTAYLKAMTLKYSSYRG